MVYENHSQVARFALVGLLALPTLAQGQASAPRPSAPRDSALRDSTPQGSTPQGLAPVVVNGPRSARAPYRLASTRSATRTETPLRELAQSITVVARELIDDQGMQSMADVARYVPGVTMGLGEGHRDAPTIRGQSSTADFFLDGARDDAQYLRDLYNVDRVEVLKGANALAFGRGGGGGLVHRVTRDAAWRTIRTLTTEGGSFDHGRVTVDVGQALSTTAAGRLNAMVQSSGGFRVDNAQRRWAVHPTLALRLAPSTLLRLRGELFQDDRTIDRGIPSFRGGPVEVPRTTFFGNPAVNVATMQLRSATAVVDHATPTGLQLRSQLRWMGYDKFYQNSFPDAVTAAGDQVALAAYHHRIDRRNLLSQSDVQRTVQTGAFTHQLLAGMDLGRQETAQRRATGYFHGTSLSLLVPLTQPTVTTPIEFRPHASDPEGRSVLHSAALFLQDQLQLTNRVRVIAGLRLERVGVDWHNARDGRRLSRTDLLLTPRLGLIVTPVPTVTMHGSLTQSALPSSGDQFQALSPTTALLVPERFTNRELGVTWEPTADLTVTGALYRLDRTNSMAPDPVDPTRVVQTGAQRSQGVEVGITGAIRPWWQVAGGATVQSARIRQATSTARAGATVPLVPGTTASLWNRWRLHERLGVGLGVVHQRTLYAAVDNRVRLPGFTRMDVGLSGTLRPWLRAQLQVENLLDRWYFATTHGNNNIMPGTPRTIRMMITAGAP